MSINRSEEFLYFQNKSKHYENIRKIKATVDDKLSKSLRNTIDHSAEKNNKKLVPYLKRLQLDIENQKMINRLVGICNSKRKQVQINGDYSRYNDTQRKFRQKNPYRDSVTKKIEEQNEEIVNKLSNVKPLVGSSILWDQQYQYKKSHCRNLSRFADSQKSKGSLILNTDKFLPEHYKKMIQNDQSLEKSQKLGVAIIPKYKLISLPKILSRERSSSVLLQSKSKSTLDI